MDVPVHENTRMNSGRVQRTYSLFARLYDLWGLIVARPAHRVALEMADIREGERVLEVAVGTGLLFLKVVPLNRLGMNVGFDLTPSMLRVAVYRTRKLDGASAHFGIGNACSIPLKDGCVDLVLNIFMLDLLSPEDARMVLAECHRVLRPGGRIVTVDRARAESWHHKRFEEFYRTFPSLWGSGRGTSIAPELEAAGFADLRKGRGDHWSFPVEVLRGGKPIP